MQGVADLFADILYSGDEDEEPETGGEPIRAVCALHPANEFDLLFDTTTAKSVLRKGMAPDIETMPSRGTALAQADGTVVEHFW